MNAIVVEPYDAMLKKSQSDLARNLSRRLSSAKSKPRKKMRSSDASGLKENSQRLSEADFVIEAAVENSAVKTDIFSQS